MFDRNCSTYPAWMRKGSVVFLLMTAVLTAMLGWASTAAAQSPCGDTVTVVLGDTLEEIADRCETTVESLLQANPGIADPEQLEVGQVLVIPSPEDPDAPITYTVQPGDWLSRIAQRYNTTLQAILAANPDITNPNRIRVGQEILIPLGGEEQDAAVTISPDAGPPGTEVQVTASGYPANVEIIVGIGTPEAEPVTSHTVTTNDQGTATTTVTVPEDAQVNERYTVVAYVPEPGGARDTSGNFIVTSEPDDGDDDEQQVSVQISPVSGPPGTMVEVSASGLPADAIVDIGAGPVESEYDLIAAAQSDGQGTLNRSVRIPHLATPGEEWVIVVTPTGSPADYISNAFAVTEPAADDDETRFTRTNIYLIALEDEGRSGMQIGCNDSVVPVEVEIAPTLAVLTAAMEALVSLDERFYGESGLYNALYRSELSVAEIQIEDREAVIQLTGQVSLGGVCDVPRLREQLRQTALQFYTIDSVSIFINGDPLDQVIQ